MELGDGAAHPRSDRFDPPNHLAHQGAAVGRGSGKAIIRVTRSCNITFACSALISAASARSVQNERSVSSGVEYQAAIGVQK